MSRAAPRAVEPSRSQRVARQAVLMRRRIRAWLPEGRVMPTPTWERRHRLITRFALLQAVGVALFGLLMGRPLPACVVALVFVGSPAVLALVSTASRRMRTLSTVVSLMLAS